MTILIIYTSGLIFFILQAHRYATLSAWRIWGAIIWPVTLMYVPWLVRCYRASMEHVGHEGRLAGMAWGLAPDGTMVWGIGA